MIVIMCARFVASLRCFQQLTTSKRSSYRESTQSHWGYSSRRRLLFLAVPQFNWVLLASTSFIRYFFKTIAFILKWSDWTISVASPNSTLCSGVQTAHTVSFAIRPLLGSLKLRDLEYWIVRSFTKELSILTNNFSKPTQ